MHFCNNSKMSSCAKQDKITVINDFLENVILIPQEKFEISFVMLITTNVPQKVKVEILHRKLRKNFYYCVPLKFSVVLVVVFFLISRNF